MRRYEPPPIIINGGLPDVRESIVETVKNGGDKSTQPVPSSNQLESRAMSPSMSPGLRTSEEHSLIPSPQKLKPRGPAPWDTIDAVETLRTLNGTSVQPILNLDKLKKKSFRNPLLG
jgi:hypothetical protein